MKKVHPLSIVKTVKALCLFVVALCGPNRHEHISSFNNLKKSLRTRKRSKNLPWMVLCPHCEIIEFDSIFHITEQAKSALKRLSREDDLSKIILLYNLPAGANPEEIIPIAGKEFKLGKIQRPDYVARAIAGSKKFVGELFLHTDITGYTNETYENEPHVVSIIMDDDLPVISICEITEPRYNLPHSTIYQLYLN